MVHGPTDQPDFQCVAGEREGEGAYLSVSSRSACWKWFLPSSLGPSASAWETSAFTLVKKFWTKTSV